MISSYLDPQIIRRGAGGFVRSLGTGRPGEFRQSPGGKPTLYASCYAAMILRIAGELDGLDPAERLGWADYIRGWQDPESGFFAGPELSRGRLGSAKHDRDHLVRHTTAHVLPALELLGAAPLHPLRAAHAFLDPAALRAWLGARNWREAWFEGNNILFAGQFLVHLRDVEKATGAAAALDLYFDWLDAEQDPATGLWGTNGHCDAFAALYGGYHQLLVYYYCGRTVKHAERIIDTTLELQADDGSFARGGGGGACEDVDAVDVLVNLFERTGYRRLAVRHALGRALESVLTQRNPDGGFVYRRGSPFEHMGIELTRSEKDVSNLFPTWFRLHTIALIGQILRRHPLAAGPWGFNRACSMGWHDPAVRPPWRPDPWRDVKAALGRRVRGEG